MRARRTIRTLVSTLVLLPAAVGASAGDPSVTILQPTAGATHSKAAGPIAVSGAVGFEQPAPADTRLFLRYAAEGGTNCGRRYLSTTNGPDPGNSCQSTGAHLTLAGQSFTRDWPADPAEVALPLTLDASRNITGEININSRFLGTAGAPLASPGNWVTLDVVVRPGDTALTQSFDSGLYTGATRKFSLNLDIPASLDKVDVSAVQVDLVWHRVIHLSQSVAGVASVNVIHTYAELENPPSFVSVPSYTSSFNRRVELTIDNPTFSGTKTNATVNLATGTFSASMPTTFVQPGTRTIYARAIQGGKVSPVDSVPITVTS